MTSGANENQWPPYDILTEDQKKRYRYLRDNSHWGDAFIYNEMAKIARTLEGAKSK